MQVARMLAMLTTLGVTAALSSVASPHAVRTAAPAVSRSRRVVLQSKPPPSATADLSQQMREMREAMQEPMRAAEQAKADLLDPFNQAASAATGATTTPLGDTDPPLPSATDGRDGDSDDPPAPDA